MKTRIKNPFFLPALTAGLGLMLADRVPAQTFTNLHSFNGTNGASPYATLVVSGNTLYGTTKAGGLGGGTVFRINSDGTAFTNLHYFEATSGPLSTNSDGANPYARLVLSGGTLYGTAPYGGTDGNGTVFKVNTDGTGFSVLHTFLYPDHGEPYDGLILAGDTLYGTTGESGSFGWGSVFAMKINGTGFTNLHSFNLDGTDGFYPYSGGGLLLSGNTLYGTTLSGGSSNAGTVFKVNTDGSSYTILYNFTYGNDGANPNSGLVLSGNALYGTVCFGGSTDQGDVFKINTDGSGFTNLHSFTGGFNEAYSDAGLFLSGNVLYGTTYLGGLGNNGTVFRLNTNGSGFTNLYHFAGAPDGAYLYGGLILSGNTLYGTASAGGSSGNGTVFSLVLPLPPLLTILRSGTNVVLTWPTNDTGYTLQSATNVVSATGWTPVSPGPVVVNGQNAVTNPASGTWKFFKLSP